MKILVFGSRTFNDYDCAYIVMLGLRETYGGAVTVVHGAAKGADSLAAHWASSMGLNLVACPADWSQGRKGGVLRNQRMLDENPDICLAIGFIDKPLEESRGSHDMAQRLTKANIRHYIIRSCGPVD